MAATQNEKTKGNQVHLVLQGKGGVGKSLISAILGQYFQTRKTTPHCFDTDPVNATFAQYRALEAEHINVLRRGAIHDKRFDELFEKICTLDGVCIVDTGATTFVPLWNYILENDILTFLAGRSRRVFVHCVVTCRRRRIWVPVQRSRGSQVWGYALACGRRRNGEADSFLSQVGFSSLLTSGVR
jgi:hypothetical protein